LKRSYHSTLMDQTKVKVSPLDANQVKKCTQTVICLETQTTIQCSLSKAQSLNITPVSYLRYRTCKLPAPCLIRGQRRESSLSCRLLIKKTQRVILRYHLLKLEACKDLIIDIKKTSLAMTQNLNSIFRLAKYEVDNLRKSN
jgi:hypothetical protein